MAISHNKALLHRGDLAFALFPLTRAAAVRRRHAADPYRGKIGSPNREAEVWIQATVAADGRRIYLNARNIRKIVEDSGVSIVHFDDTDAIAVREAAAELVRAAPFTPSPESQMWHWAEGNKYAAQAYKTLIALNGGAAVALLAFVGNQASDASAATGPLAWSLFWLGLGAAAATVSIAFAYQAQLQYGNEGTQPKNYWHAIATGGALASIALFAAGLWCARTSVLEIMKAPTLG